MWFLFLYITFNLVLVVLYFLNKKYLSDNKKYLYLAYRNVLFILVIWSLSYKNLKLDDELWYLNYTIIDDIQLIFFSSVLPWVIFGIKNYILVKYYNIKLNNLLTVFLLDYIKMFLIFSFSALFLALLGYFIN